MTRYLRLSLPLFPSLTQTHTYDSHSHSLIPPCKRHKHSHKDTSIKLVYSFTFKCLATNSTAALYPYTPIPQTTATALSLK